VEPNAICNKFEELDLCDMITGNPLRWAHDQHNIDLIISEKRGIRSLLLPVFSYRIGVNIQ